MLTHFTGPLKTLGPFIHWNMCMYVILSHNLQTAYFIYMDWICIFYYQCEWTIHTKSDHLYSCLHWHIVHFSSSSCPIYLLYSSYSYLSAFKIRSRSFFFNSFPIFILYGYQNFTQFHGHFRLHYGWKYFCTFRIFHKMN